MKFNVGLPALVKWANGNDGGFCVLILPESEHKILTEQSCEAYNAGESFLYLSFFKQHSLADHQTLNEICTALNQKFKGNCSELTICNFHTIKNNSDEILPKTKTSSDTVATQTRFVKETSTEEITEITEATTAENSSATSSTNTFINGENII